MLEGLRAGTKLQRATWLTAEPQIQAEVVPTQWQAVYKIKERNRLEGHSDAVIGVAFSPDGKTIASASSDKTVILWNLNLDDLLVRGCNWVRDYLQNNSNVSESDRSLCDGVK